MESVKPEPGYLSTAPTCHFVWTYSFRASLGMILWIYNIFYSTGNTFLFGNDYSTFKEIDQSGTTLNEGIICDECNGGNIIFKKDGDTLMAIEDNSVLHLFEETDTPTTHYLLLPDTADFYEYTNTTPTTFYNTFFTIYMLFISVPFAKTLFLLNKKKDAKQFFELL